MSVPDADSFRFDTAIESFHLQLARAARGAISSKIAPRGFAKLMATRRAARSAAARATGKGISNSFFLSRAI